MKAGLIAAATAAAFYEVGELTGHNPAFGTAAHIENVVGHALVGCASAAASGAKCGPSALAGVVTSFAGPAINNQGFVGGLVANTVLGGVAAVAGGGKFANGAITGAFGYLFNASLGERRENHELAVGQEMAKYQAMGFITTPNVALVVDGIRVVIDIMVSTPAFPMPNPQFGVDVKTGDAELSENQALVYPQLLAGTWATPVGLRALQAGFIPYVPVWIQMKVAIPRYPGTP